MTQAHCGTFETIMGAQSPGLLRELRVEWGNNLDIVRVSGRLETDPSFEPITTVCAQNRT